MRKICVVLLLSFVAASLGPVSIPVAAGPKEDAARIERKFEIRKLAREIFDRASTRAKEAARASPTIQANNDAMIARLNECHALANDAITKADKLAHSLAKKNLLRQARAILDIENANSCIRLALDANPNAGIIDELRDEFIAEEIDQLHDTLDKPKRKALEAEIRELSI